MDRVGFPLTRVLLELFWRVNGQPRLDYGKAGLHGKDSLCLLSIVSLTFLFVCMVVVIFAIRHLTMLICTLTIHCPALLSLPQGR